MALAIENMAVGDVLGYWHDAGCMGAEIAFARIVRVGPKMVRVRDERGNEAWKYPHWFARKVSTQAVVDLRAEGLKI